MMRPTAKSKVFYVLMVFFSIALNLASQNLVINSTVEGKRIKAAYGEILKANGWENANGGTADLYDKTKSGCGAHLNGIPYNYMGYQPSSDGQNYAGIVAYYDDGGNNYSASTNSVLITSLRNDDGYKRYTEYIEGEFREPMVAGNVYQVSFRVNLANNSGRAVSCLGALISHVKMKQTSNSFLPHIPQFISHRVISDTAEWVVLSGAYIAEGGEKFITLGCFKDNQFLVEKVVGAYQNDSRKAYYYISEVSVVPYGALKPSLEGVVNGVDYVELMNVQFALGNTEVLPQFYSELDELASWMVKSPGYKFFVAGYADRVGEKSVNDSISLQRAERVKDYLVNKGVNAGNLLTEGFGSRNQLESQVKSRKNRRVEIYLYSAPKTSQL